MTIEKNWRWLAAAGALAALAACGGGGDGSTEPVAAAPATAEGLWTGSTSTGRSMTGLVLDDGSYWLIYTLPNDGTVIAGAVQGTSSSSAGTLTSHDGRDFNLEGAGVADFALSGSFSAKQSLQGEITYAGSSARSSFTATYRDDYAKPATLAAVAGSYSGVSATKAGTEAASFTIAASGAISGYGDSGCRFTGTLRPRGAVAAYDVSISFLGGVCAMGTATIQGAAFVDGSSGRLFAAALNATRVDGVIFAGQRAAATGGSTAPTSPATPTTPSSSSFGSTSSSVVSSGSSSGCGSRGGPGYRKANGQCASWADYYAGRR